MKKVVLFKNSSEEYEKAFVNSNFEVIFVEPLQFNYVNTDKLQEKLAQSYDGLILTSPRAVEAVAQCWDPAKFVAWNARKTYTVGDASQRKICSLLGLEALGASAGNAEKLAEIIVNENSKNTKFLFPCGNLRSETLPNMLQEGEIDIDAVTVYETKENQNLEMDLRQLNELEHELCSVVFFSPSGCEYVYRQLQVLTNRLSAVPHFAIGRTTAHKIESFGVDVAGVAAKPNAEGVVESVLKYLASV